jgi:hypothetical protein
MFRSVLFSALATAALGATVAWAQAPPSVATPDKPAIKTDDAQNLPQKIREKLTADGFKDVQVVPNSFLVSAKDKDGNPVMMLIGPNGTTVVKKSKAGPPSGPPSTAEHKDGEDQIIQE